MGEDKKKEGTLSGMLLCCFGLSEEGYVANLSLSYYSFPMFQQPPGGLYLNVTS